MPKLGIFFAFIFSFQISLGADGRPLDVFDEDPENVTYRSNRSSSIQALHDRYTVELYLKNELQGKSDEFSNEQIDVLRSYLIGYFGDPTLFNSIFENLYARAFKTVYDHFVYVPFDSKKIWSTFRQGFFWGESMGGAYEFGRLILYPKEYKEMYPTVQESQKMLMFRLIEGGFLVGGALWAIAVGTWAMESLNNLWKYKLIFSYVPEDSLIRERLHDSVATQAKLITLLSIGANIDNKRKLRDWRKAVFQLNGKINTFLTETHESSMPMAERFSSEGLERLRLD